MQKITRYEERDERDEIFTTMINAIDGLGRDILDVMAYGSRFSNEGYDITKTKPTAIIRTIGELHTIISWKVFKSLNKHPVYIIEPNKKSFDTIKVYNPEANKYVLIFYRNTQVVEKLYLPPVSIEDSSILLLNQTLLKQINTHISSRLISFIEDSTVILNNIPTHKLIEYGRRKLNEELSEPLVATEPLIVKVPIKGRELQAVYLLRTKLVENLIGETVLADESSAIIEYRSFRVFIPADDTLRAILFSPSLMLPEYEGVEKDIDNLYTTLENTAELLLLLYGFQKILNEK